MSTTRLFNKEEIKYLCVLPELTSPINIIHFTSEKFAEILIKHNLPFLEIKSAVSGFNCTITDRQAYIIWWNENIKPLVQATKPFMLFEKTKPTSSTKRTVPHMVTAQVKIQQAIDELQLNIDISKLTSMDWIYFEGSNILKKVDQKDLETRFRGKKNHWFLNRLKPIQIGSYQNFLNNFEKDNLRANLEAVQLLEQTLTEPDAITETGERKRQKFI